MNQAQSCGRVRPPLRALARERSDHAGGEPHCVGIEVGTRPAGCPATAFTGYQRRDVRVLEEVVVAFDINLESEPIAEKADGDARPPSTEFNVACEVDAEVRRDRPLRLRGRRGADSSSNVTRTVSNRHGRVSCYEDQLGEQNPAAAFVPSQA